MATLCPTTVSSVYDAHKNSLLDELVIPPLPIPLPPVISPLHIPLPSPHTPF